MGILAVDSIKSRTVAPVTVSDDLNVTGVSTVGVLTATSVVVGSAVTANSSGIIAGLVTATTFSGAFSGTTGTFSGDVSIGGTLTYEDVERVDATGLSTFREGLNVGSPTGVGGTFDPAGGLSAGIGSFSSDLNIADKIVHLGDTDTTIRFADADTITAETGGSERLRIKDNGDVLIGRNSTSTGYPLCVQSDTSAEGIAVIGRASDDIGAIDFYEADKSTLLGELQYRRDHLNMRHRVGDIRFCTAGASEKVRIDSSGRLRVASTTESADSAFDDLIVGNHSGNRGISILSTNGQQGALGFAKSGTLADGYVAYVHNSTATSSAMTIKSSGHIQFNAGSSEKVRITSAGLVGIGIATPDSLLHLEGSGSTAKIKLQRTGTTIGGSINTRDESGDKGLTYLAKDGNSGVPAHVFQTDAGSGAVERLRIASNGDIESANSVQSGGNATSGFKIGSADTAAYMSVQSKSVANGGSTSNAAFQAWLGSSNTFRVNANGLIKTSAGVDFSGAQTNYSGMSSEVLDSYEEGTFTPSINGMGSISYSVQAGKYTKIGNTVFFQIRFNLSSRTAGSHAHITNMPFTASTATIQYAQCTVYAIQGLHCSTNHHPIGQFQSSEIYLYQVGYQSSSNYSNIDENQISGTAQFGVYGFYYTS